MSASLPTLTVVIPTLNRPQAIVDVVEDLCRQEYPVFSILVVDSSAELNPALAGLASIEPRLTVLRVPPHGTCFSRNTGVRAATGDIIVFTDDDVRIGDPRFLHAHAQQYTDSTVAGVGGRVHDANRELNRQQTGLVCLVTRTGRFFPNADSTVRQDINAPRGANMSYRRQTILDLDGFDERFRGNAMREETDFSLRVVKAGHRIVFEPSAELLHLGLSGGSRSRDRLNWYRDFFFNESYFFLKHFPRVFLPLLFWRKIRAIGACWLYYGHGGWRWFRAPWQSFSEAARLIRPSQT